MNSTFQPPLDGASACPSPSDLDAKGYSVIRDVITANEVDTMRSALKTYFKSSGRYQYGGKFQLRGMHVLPEVSRILASEHVLNLIKEHTRPRDPILTGECDLTFNTTSGWHKDITKDMGFDNSIFDDENFRVYKLAFYLQDQDATSRSALKVRPGSHRRADGRDLPVETLANRAGDAIIFDVRIDHAGQFPTLSERLLNKFLMRTNSFSDSQKWFTRARSVVRWFRRGTTARMAVFMTFGPAETWTRAYENAGRHRHGEPPAELNPEIARKLSASNVTMIQSN